MLTIRDMHYGTFTGSGIFISNPKYRILFWNNLLGAKSRRGWEPRSAITRHVN